MKKILYFLITGILFFTGCSCNNQELLFDKLSRFQEIDLKTYSIEYNKYEDDTLIISYTFSSLCNSEYCEYYFRKVEGNSSKEYVYKYANDHYDIYQRVNNVNGTMMSAPLTISDRSFEININTLYSYINDDLNHYREGDNHFSYELNKKTYTTLYQVYDLDDEVTKTVYNSYTFSDDYVTKLTSVTEYADSSSVEKVTIEMKYTNISLPDFQ